MAPRPHVPRGDGVRGRGLVRLPRSASDGLLYASAVRCWYMGHGNGHYGSLRPRPRIDRPQRRRVVAGHRVGERRDE